jgi:hypothetical protein
MLHYPQDFEVLWTGDEELLPPREEHSLSEQFNRVYGLQAYECRDGRGDLRQLSGQDLSQPKPFKLVVTRTRRKQHYVRSNH